MKAYGISILLGYLLGCSSMAYYIGMTKRFDPRTSGSRNLGASNVTILFGWKWGAIVGIHDIGKALLAVILAAKLFPESDYAGLAAGVSCVLGHMFPFYLGFRGGKGLASYLGMTLALNWRLALAICLLIVMITLITDYIVIGTVSAAVSIPAAMGILSRDWKLAVILAIGSMVMIYKHRENLVRIWRGEEFGFRGAARGEKRVK